MAYRKVKLNSIRNLIQYRSRINPDKAREDLIGGLAEEGYRLIQLAYASRNWENRTKNLKDSYVSAVFENGVLVKDSVRFLSRMPEAEKTNRGWSGRDEANYFLDEIGGRLKKHGIALVVGAAMFYAHILEVKWKYRVLANIDSELRALAQYGVAGRKYVAKFDLDAENSIVYRLDRKRT